MRSIVLALPLLLTWPVSGAETSWQELAPDVRARLISSDVLNSDGTSLIGLELDMPENVKTYWRIPGETGIPTELTLEGSSGIQSHEVLWPYPLVDRKGGYLDYVYYGPTVLPVRLDVDAPVAALQAEVTMGICSEICVPVTASFSLPLDFTTPDRGQGLRINQAVARAPIDWDRGSEPFSQVALDPSGAALRVGVADPRIDPASVIASLGEGETLFGVPQKSPEPNLVLLPLLGNEDHKGLEGRAVHLTFMTEDGPYEVSREIMPLAVAGQ